MSSRSAPGSPPIPTPDRSGEPDRAGAAGRWAALDPAVQRVVRRALIGVGAYVLVSLLLLGGSALFARAGLNELRSLRSDAGPPELLDGSAADRIETARRSFGRASTLADNVALAPLRLLPIVGGL